MREVNEPQVQAESDHLLMLFTRRHTNKKLIFLIDDENKRKAEATTLLRSSRYRVEVLSKLNPYQNSEANKRVQPRASLSIYTIADVVKACLPPRDQAVVVKRWIGESDRDLAFMAQVLWEFRDRVEAWPFGLVFSWITDLSHYGIAFHQEGRTARDVVALLAGEKAFGADFEKLRALDRAEDDAKALADAARAERYRTHRLREEAEQRMNELRRAEEEKEAEERKKLIASRAAYLEALPLNQRIIELAESTEPSICELPDRLAIIPIHQLAPVPSDLRRRLSEALGSNAVRQWKHLARVLTNGSIEAAQARAEIEKRLDGIPLKIKLASLCEGPEPFWKFPTVLASEGIKNVMMLDDEIRARILARLPKGHGPWAEFRKAIKRTYQ
jgi:hypothetical protein